tara:strand:- start:144 stop:428 length:285 start_codon:yes stop_codon:yes gene_type:complete
LHYALKNLRVKINRIPINAGNTKLIIHKQRVADKIPIELFETKVNRYNATEPRIPISVIAIVGIIEITNNIVDVKIIELMYDTSTEKRFNRIKN